MDIKTLPLDRPCAINTESDIPGAHRGSQLKGTKGDDHRSPDNFISGLFRNLREIAAKPDEDKVATSAVPVPHKPCALPMDSLRPIMISKMKPETYYPRTKILLRVTLQPERLMRSVAAAAEDEEGTVVLLNLYHQPDEEVVPVRHLLRAGDICVVKRPVLRSSSGNPYWLRVDHVSEVVWLEDTSPLIPSRWRAQVPDLKEDSSSIRARGNEAVKKQSWAEAESLYSSAIEAAKTPDEANFAYLNRSLANLKLGRPTKARLDATRVSNTPKVSSKSLFREARALYELAEFKPCHDKLSTLLSSDPTNKDALSELSRVNERLREKAAGEYAFHRMYEQAKKTPPLIDCATYSAPVEVRDSIGKGRGLFTTRAVSAGDLLLCEKAFAYVFSGEDGAGHTSVLIKETAQRVITGGYAHLITQIVQKMLHDPDASREFRDLYSGDYAPAPPSKVDGLPVVDSCLVEKIISLNGFGAPRTSKEAFVKSFSDPKHRRFGGGPTHDTCGIWVLAARINHSCTPNCQRSFIGDMQMVRAATDMEAGTELLFTYRQPGSLESYESIQKGLSDWGKVKQGRIDRAQPRLGKLFEKLENLLPSAGGIVGSRLPIADPYSLLSIYFMCSSEETNALDMGARCLETFGFRTAAFPPVGDQMAPRIEITRWRLVDGRVPVAFSHLFTTYQRIEPEFCALWKEYTRRAYSIIVGEGETVGERFPALLEDY
ncbi:related to TPR domain protein [Cephalotrichum gorgonifer]|uniref:Related to TPR domain protein n=1 Tax=Cephalotrichum gorgonifer TaxID=2041049 RepID=A0AAE8N419_9PEZI|nr:related to TPR domain protein [Cephalotrichum gorgonifer]